MSEQMYKHYVRWNKGPSRPWWLDRMVKNFYKIGLQKRKVKLQSEWWVFIGYNRKNIFDLLIRNTNISTACLYDWDCLCRHQRLQNEHLTNVISWPRIK